MTKRPASAGLFAGGGEVRREPLGRGIPVHAVSGGAASGTVVIAAVMRGETWGAAERLLEAAAEGRGNLSVHELVDEALQPLIDRIGLVLRERLASDRVVERRPGGVENRLLQPVDGLALGLGDVRERLAVAEPLEELRRRQAEVVGRRLELVAEEEGVIRPRGVGPVAAEAEDPGPEEPRRVAGLDPGLQL